MDRNRLMAVAVLTVFLPGSVAATMHTTSTLDGGPAIQYFAVRVIGDGHCSRVNSDGRLVSIDAEKLSAMTCCESYLWQENMQATYAAMQKVNGHLASEWRDLTLSALPAIAAKLTQMKPPRRIDPADLPDRTEAMSRDAKDDTGVRNRIQCARGNIEEMLKYRYNPQSAYADPDGNFLISGRAMRRLLGHAKNIRRAICKSGPEWAPAAGQATCLSTLEEFDTVSEREKKSAVSEEREKRNDRWHRVHDLIDRRIPLTPEDNAFLMGTD